MTQLLNVSEALATHARLCPDEPGARDSRRQLTWSQWDARASQLANAMLSLGLRVGDRVAVLAYNTLEWMEIYTGLGRAGMVVVPINFRLVADEVAYIANNCEARAMIVQSSLLDKVQGMRHNRSQADALHVSHWVCLGESTPTNWLGYEDLLAKAHATPPAVMVRPEDPFALMYTSGTTGQPKGVIRNHGGNSLIAMATLLEFGFTRRDTGLLVMPLCHANSLYFGLTFLYLGAPIVIDDRASFDPEAVLATFARERVTFTSLVPTHYVMMHALPAKTRHQYDLRSVDKLLISSAPARRDTKLAILEQFPNSRLFELYGASETGWVSLLRPEDQLDHIGSVGREWLGSGPIRLLDEDGREVPDGEVGELFSRTPYVFDGYWRNPEKTQAAFRGAWCSVGDMARRDKNGFIYLVDRKANMIITGGENVYPSEVESVIAVHPSVRDVAVIGVPDPKWGESVHAVVVLHEHKLLDSTTLIDYCRSRIAGYKRPRSVEFIDESAMPRTATGKIQHAVLRARRAGRV